MKKNIAFLIVLLFVLQYGFAQKTDSILNSISDKASTLQQTVEAMKSRLDTASKADSTKNKCNCVPFATLEPMGFWKTSLVASPFLLLILVVVLVAIQLWKFNFTEAFTENEPPKKVIKNPEYNAEVIAANASIPNLSILFPTTIEVSNIEPTLTDLQEIVGSKDAAIKTLEIALEAAKTAEPVLAKAANDAKTKLEELSGKITALNDAVTAATTERNAAGDEVAKAAAEIKLSKATTALDVNTLIEKTAQANLDDANKKVTENTSKITSLPDQIEKARQAALDARKNIDVYQKLKAGGTLFSPTTYRPSISRYIAFISSLVIILIAVCMSSFFIYHYIRTGCPPEFGALTGMLIVLGLGVTPYITNKITTAATTNKP